MVERGITRWHYRYRNMWNYLWRWWIEEMAFFRRNTKRCPHASYRKWIFMLLLRYYSWVVKCFSEGISIQQNSLRNINLLKKYPYLHWSGNICVHYSFCPCLFSSIFYFTPKLNIPEVRPVQCKIFSEKICSKRNW